MNKEYFSYIWEYFVREDNQSKFRKAYGKEGDWVQLFKKAKGYIKTDLYHDKTNTERFLTVDLWNSETDFHHFKKNYLKEYKNLDKQFEAFTKEENFLGNFNNLNH